MTLPANIRINVGAPFPSLLKASGPVTLSKKNGIWGLGFNIANLGTQTPPLSNYATDYLVVWDSAANTHFKMPLSAVLATQRAVQTAADLPLLPFDSILNINAATDLTPVLPLAGTRFGAPLVFKNMSSSVPQTLTATAPDLLEGAATLPLGVGQSVTLRPYDDGVNNALGYAVES